MTEREQSILQPLPFSAPLPPPLPNRNKGNEKSSAKCFLLFCLSQFVVHLFTFLLVPHGWLALQLVLCGGPPGALWHAALLVFGSLHRLALAWCCRSRFFGLRGRGTIPVHLGMLNSKKLDCGGESQVEVDRAVKPHFYDCVSSIKNSPELKLDTKRNPFLRVRGPSTRPGWVGGSPRWTRDVKLDNALCLEIGSSKMSSGSRPVEGASAQIHAYQNHWKKCGKIIMQA